MISKQFEAFYRKLNTEQKKAVDTIEGPVMVIAGPGTGKTQVLILRIAKILLETQIEPENILALTFTDSAVYEMRKRLVDLIGTPGYRVEINTFHGFCNKLIQHNPSEFEELVESESIEELGQLQIIESILEKNSFTHIKPFGAPLHFAKSILHVIGDLKKEGVSVKAFAQGIKEQEKDFDGVEDLYNTKGPYTGKMKGKYMTLQKKIEKNKELITVYKKYEEALISQKKYDYNDMLLKVLSSFEGNKNLLLQMQELFQYFLVDEHQDTNKAQNKIIEYLCNYYPNPNLFVVGDEKQAIYRFQGATLENFLYFKHLYKDATLINLTKNYRSTQIILDAAHSLIKHNSASQILLPDSFLSAASLEKKREIEIAELSSFYEEYYYVAREIKKKIKAGANPREIAILARNNRDIDPFAEVFENLSIPYIVESDQNIFKDLTVQKLLSLFYAIDRLGSDIELVDVMHIDVFEIDPIDIYKLILFAREKHTFLWDVLSLETYKKNVILKKQEKIEDFVKKITEWKTISMNDTFDNVFIGVLNDSGFLKRILSHRHRVDVIEKVSLLYTEIKKLVSRNHLFNLHEFIAYIELLKAHKISPSTAHKLIHKSGVRLMTAHKAKGQEFDYVYIINVHDGHWGNKRHEGNLFDIPWRHLSVTFDTVTQSTGDDDDRRLFYVALTRGRKQITLSYSSQGADDREQVLSQFAEEINSLFKKRINTDAFKKYVASHPEMMLEKKIDKGAKIEKDLLQNKQFFNELFVRRGLSVSGLNNYLECPWKYFFRNLLLLPDVKNKSMIFGSAIHEALNLYLLEREKNKVDENFVIQKYREALDKQPLNQQELAELTKKGESVLKEYVNARAFRWPHGLESELNIKGIRFAEGIFLNGKIDMIERLDKKGDVAVYDFKTGKPKTRSYIEGTIKSSKGDYKRQLVFYKILIDRYKEGKLKMNVVEGIIEFVEKNEKGEYQSERFTISKQEEDDLEKLIYTVAGEIKNLSFIDKTCEDPACNYCRLRSFMMG
ncbi:ATP-dependent helicase [Candidatus Roizmanbacteria bacterium]|nr:ATP-dependent helicase [Candidatus Roizmanbacteria bacterium]